MRDELWLVACVDVDGEVVVSSLSKLETSKHVGVQG